jgi:hypothetical protein
VNTAVSPDTISLYFPSGAGVHNVEPNWTPVENRAEIARYFSPTGDYAEVDMQRPPTFYVAFGKGSPGAVYGTRVETVLKDIHQWITNYVIRPLAPTLADSRGRKNAT